MTSSTDVPGTSLHRGPLLEHCDSAAQRPGDECREHLAFRHAPPLPARQCVRRVWLAGLRGYHQLRATHGKPHAGGNQHALRIQRGLECGVHGPR
jgi:hypothetical protein